MFRKFLGSLRMILGIERLLQSPTLSLSLYQVFSWFIRNACKAVYKTLYLCLLNWSVAVYVAHCNTGTAKNIIKDLVSATRMPVKERLVQESSNYVRNS